ncbi:MAG: hypothetical protein ACTSPB_23285 [Candidatus Thorarchaeota archaeon]
MALKKIIARIKQSWDNWWVEFESLDYETKEMILRESIHKGW